MLLKRPTGYALLIGCLLALVLWNVYSSTVCNEQKILLSGINSDWQVVQKAKYNVLESKYDALKKERDVFSRYIVSMSNCTSILNSPGDTDTAIKKVSRFVDEHPELKKGMTGDMFMIMLNKTLDDDKKSAYNDCIKKASGN